MGLIDQCSIGDFDGDTSEIYWSPVPVSTSENAPLVTQLSLDDKFVGGTEKVSEFLFRTASLDLDKKILGMHSVLLDGLQNSSSVGIYANLHDFAIYTKGYADPLTVYLGRM